MRSHVGNKERAVLKAFWAGEMVRWAVGVMGAVLLSATCLSADDGASSPGIDQLLGGTGRQDHARRLEELKIGGKTFRWEDYAGWGRELFLTSRVANPPTGAGPSKSLSEFYRCTDCHNNRREDLVLTHPNSHDRQHMIESDQRKPGEAPLRLASGTTLWGAVNRSSFYNDSFETYHTLEVEGGRPMDPTSLEDATQVCCRYCSVGRFAEPWEMASLLTYFWELEVQLSDLELPASFEGPIVSLMKPTAPPDADLLRAFLGRQVMSRAPDDYTHPPIESTEEYVEYPDHCLFAGDADIGRGLYQAACVHCHGEGKVCETEGHDLVTDEEYFHEILSLGTERADTPYMPKFTAARLNRQQIVDILWYLRSEQ